MNTSESEAFAMRTKIAQMEHDLRILADEVRAWRRFWYADEDDDESLQRAKEHKESVTNESNVLSRISE